MSSLLANPNITLTPRDKSKDNTAADSAPVASLSVSENITSRPIRPETVDLTLEPLPSQNILTKNLTCQVCDKTFSSAPILRTHLQLHLKRSIPAYNRISPPVAGSISAGRRSSSDLPHSVPPQPNSNLHTLETVSSSNETNRTASIDSNSPLLNTRIPDPLATTPAECMQGQARSSPVSISSKPPPPSASHQKNGSTNELFIPIVDVSRADVLSQLVIHFSNDLSSLARSHD